MYSFCSVSVHLDLIALRPNCILHSEWPNSIEFGQSECNRVKMYGSSFNESFSVIFILPLFPVELYLKKKRILGLTFKRKQILPLRADSMWKSFMVQGSKLEVTEAVPLCKNSKKKTWGCTQTLLIVWSIQNEDIVDMYDNLCMITWSHLLLRSRKL